MGWEAEIEACGFGLDALLCGDAREEIQGGGRRTPGEPNAVVELQEHGPAEASVSQVAVNGRRAGIHDWCGALAVPARRPDEIRLADHVYGPHRGEAVIQRFEVPALRSLFLVALGATIVASLYPATFAARTDPAVALRVAQ